LEGIDFKVTVMAYDGIPENMNNKSKFLGPEVFGFRPLNFLNWFSFGIFLLLFPGAAYWDRVKQKIADKEDKFPDFLRDLAEFWKGGLSMTVAVQTLTTSEYGALNDEIKKMSDQISWGIAFEEVLIMFANRINTPLVDRAISLINEANRAGGKISDILVTAANDTREIKFLEEERVRAISSYKAVIWTSFFVFLGVVVVLAKVFIPAIASSNAGDGGGSTTLGAMEIRAVDPLFFLTVFFYGVVMQGVGNGAMAGLMATGRVSAGFKLSGLMVVVAFVVFNIIAFAPELMGVPPPQGLNPAVGSKSGGVFVGGG
ncbi:MAG TPA: type II secretion system F family protein, partial [Candidatus Poseidoniales archaeon]|nr:type II secretion system F family protein [Candidatus Poseidoniales archaeon]